MLENMITLKDAIEVRIAGELYERFGGVYAVHVDDKLEKVLAVDRHGRAPTEEEIAEAQRILDQIPVDEYRAKLPDPDPRVTSDEEYISRTHDVVMEVWEIGNG